MIDHNRYVKTSIQPIQYAKGTVGGHVDAPFDQAMKYFVVFGDQHGVLYIFGGHGGRVSPETQRTGHMGSNNGRSGRRQVQHLSVHTLLGNGGRHMKDQEAAQQERQASSRRQEKTGYEQE